MNELEPKVKALMKQIESGTLQSNTSKVLSYIMNYRLSRGVDKTMIESDLNMKHQTSTSRLCHLEDLGLIYKDGQRSVSGWSKEDFTYSIYKYQPDEFKREQYRRKRHHDKYEAMVNRMLDEFDDMMNYQLIEALNTSLRINKENIIFKDLFGNQT